MALVCPVAYCGRTMPGSLHICKACSAELGRELHAVPGLLLDLDDAVSRQTRMTRAGEGGHSTSTRLPWDERASQAAGELTAALLGWARELAAGVQLLHGPACDRCTHPSCLRIDLCHPPGQAATAASWLHRHLDALIRHPRGPQAVETIMSAAHHARQTTDAPPRDLLYVGPCDACLSDLFARPGAALVACRRCRDEDGQRLVYGVQARRERMLRALEERILPVSDIARALTSWIRPIKPALIHTWVARRKLRPAGLDDRGRMLFRVGDVIELMRAPQEDQVVASATTK